MSHGIKNTGTFPIILINTAIAKYDGIRWNRRNTMESAELQLINIISQAIINH